MHADAGVVDQDIDFSEFGHGSPDDIVTIRFLRDIASHGNHFASQLTQFLGSLFCHIGIDIRKNKVRARFRKRFRHGLAKSGGAAGDDRTVTVQFEQVKYAHFEPPLKLMMTLTADGSLMAVAIASSTASSGNRCEIIFCIWA